MTAKEYVKAALRSARLSQADATKRVGWVPQQLSSRLARGSMRADEFLALMDAIGIDVKLFNRETGKPVVEHVPGEGRRVVQMVDGCRYDTAKADALANNFFADGQNKYNDGIALELYEDVDGRYFFAEYTTHVGAKDRIVPTDAEGAAAFIRKYGGNAGGQTADKAE